MENLYVATESVEKAQRILREMRSILSRGGFNLNKWNSINAEFFETVNSGRRFDQLQKVQPQNQKVLGLPWKPTSD